MMKRSTKPKAAQDFSRNMLKRQTDRYIVIINETINSGIIVFWCSTTSIIGIIAIASQGNRKYEGPDTLNWSSLYPFGPPPFDLSKYNRTNTTNATQPVQTYNFPKVNKSNSTIPTIGEVLRKSNIGYSNNFLAY